MQRVIAIAIRNEQVPYILFLVQVADGFKQWVEDHLFQSTAAASFNFLLVNPENSNVRTRTRSLTELTYNTSMYAFSLLGHDHTLERKFSCHLRPGDFVEVLSENDIVATLDENGALEGLPFTLEMHKYCGGKFRVLSRVDKLIIEATGRMRRLRDAVILEGVTCDGQAHGRCRSTCFLLWKEAWLRKV